MAGKLEEYRLHPNFPESRRADLLKIWTVAQKRREVVEAAGNWAKAITEIEKVNTHNALLTAVRDLWMAEAEAKK